MEEGFEPKTLKEFHELFNVRPRNEVIAKNIREEQHKIGLDAAKTMVFCESVKHAEEMAELLGGIAYHSDLEKDDRKRIMREFREGSTQVICTVDMFNEGIDIPDARLIVFLRSTQSGAIFEQQLGRGLRKMLGKDKVSVLDFVANIERIAKVRELSRSIQRRSEELGQKNGSEEGTISGDGAEEPGLRIHTQHGNFDFDKIAVNLLEKYGALKRSYAYLGNDDLVALAQILKPDGPLNTFEIEAFSKNRQFVSPATIKLRFGTIRAFQEACGFEVRERGSNDDLIKAALALKPDGPLSTPELVALSKEGKFVHPGTIVERFGSMADFHRACGFEVRDFKSLSNDDLVTIALELNQTSPLSASAMNRLSKEGKFVAASTIRSRFGGLKDFAAACGFETGPKWETKEAIIAAAQQLRPGGQMTHRDIAQYSKQGLLPSQTLLTNRFGSVKAFLEAFNQTIGQEN